VIDLDLSDMTGVELISRIKQVAPGAGPIVYRSREFTSDEEVRLRALSETLIIKDVSSPERLLDETSLFLQPVRSELAGQQACAVGEDPSIFASHDPRLAAEDRSVHPVAKGRPGITELDLSAAPVHGLGARSHQPAHAGHQCQR
jgi:hypothetical protein